MLIVETGECIANAESYISVDEAIAYHTSRGNDTWVTLTTVQQEQSLRRATDYMLAEYKLSWLGSKVKFDQSLDWPRSGVVPNEGHSALCGYGVLPYTIIPTIVKNACAELALRAAAGPLREDTERSIIREKIGPIDTTFDKDSSQSINYLEVNAMLKSLLKGTGNKSMVRLIRC
jgi:hypothetical protein